MTKVVCIKLHDEFLGELHRGVDFSNIEDNLEKFNFRKCKVGSKNGFYVDETVRNEAYERNIYPEFASLSDLKFFIDALIKIYPEETIKFNKLIKRDGSINYKRAYKAIAPLFLEHAKKSYDYYYSHDSEYEFVEKYDSDYESMENYDDSDGISMLLYKPGGFFKEHTDTPIGRKFATTLIFIPTKNLEGGDLVLKTSADTIYDPDNFLVVCNDEVRLKVSELKSPVLISFWITIPHSVEHVKSGNRICLKLPQNIPAGAQYFSETKVCLNDEIFKKSIIEGYHQQIEKLKAQIDELNAKIDNVDVETPMSHYLLDKLSKNDFCGMIILKSGPSIDSKFVGMEKILPSLEEFEIRFVQKVVQMYQFVDIITLRARRKRIPYSYNYSYSEDVECQMTNPGVGELEFWSVAKNSNILYFIDPDKNSIGTRTCTSLGYNDSNYCGFDEVKVYALVIHGKKSLL